MPYPRRHRFVDSMFETALIEGRSFRVEDDVNLAVAATKTYKFVATKRFVFRLQSYEIHLGGLEIQIFTQIPGFPITESGVFNVPLLVRAKNFTDFRTKQYNSTFGVNSGGSITGGFRTYHRWRGTDLNKSGATAIPDTNLSVSPPGTYYLVIRGVATAGNPTAEGILEIHWDELLDGGVPI